MRLGESVFSGKGFGGYTRCCSFIQCDLTFTRNIFKYSTNLILVFLLWGSLLPTSNSEVLWRYSTSSGGYDHLSYIEESPYRYTTGSEAGHEGCNNAGIIRGHMVCLNDAGEGGYCVLNQYNNPECSAGNYIVTVYLHSMEINNLCTLPQVYNIDTGECVNPDTACSVGEVFNSDTHRCEPSKPNRKTFGASLLCPSPSVGK